METDAAQIGLRRMVKQQGNDFDSFSLQVSLPSTISENERALSCKLHLHLECILSFFLFGSTVDVPTIV